MKRQSRNPGTIAGGGAAALAASVVLLRRWQRRWNATEEEVARAMPMDDEVGEPTYVTNRAVTIRARREAIWPWIAQMGELPRGGFYSYLWVERLLGMKVQNAGRVLPDFQALSVGDVLDRQGGMIVKAVEPARYVVLGPHPTADVESTWTLALYPNGKGGTRLISRCRCRLPRGLRGLLALVILDPGQFLMERKMLLEIRRRAESISSASRIEPVDAPRAQTRRAVQARGRGALPESIP